MCRFWCRVDNAVSICKCINPIGWEVYGSSVAEIEWVYYATNAMQRKVSDASMILRHDSSDWNSVVHTQMMR
jgi:hypothetical protein